MLTHHSLTTSFRALGLAAGDKVMVHSSLRSFVRVEGGPETVVRALMEVLSDEGVLLMPSFNHGAPFAPDAPGYFAPHETATTNGAIPETFRKMPGVLRSLNPTHAYAAWGREAVRFVERHHLTLTMGPDSPLGMLAREGGYALFLGTNYAANTYKHVVEMTLRVPCLGYRTEEMLVLLPDGRRVLLRTWSWRERGCPIQEPHRYVNAEMERLGLHERGRVGECETTLFRLEDSFGVMADLLASGVNGHPPCSECPIGPSRSQFTVESDWDWEMGALRPDSPSVTVGPMCWVQT